MGGINQRVVASIPSEPQPEIGIADTLHHSSVYVILLDPAVFCSASIDPAFEPKSGPGKAMRLRRYDRPAGPGTIPEPQEGTQIGNGS